MSITRLPIITATALGLWVASLEYRATAGQPTAPTAVVTESDAPAPPPPKNGGSFSITTPDKLADWQKRLTLGPGDIIDINIHEQNDSSRTGVTVGPDGRVNYLQAQDIVAAGLTVDELRDKLEMALAQFHLAPRVIIKPVNYNSKRYYMLGSVIGKGVHVLDRPVTIVEAIARARGFESTSFQRNTLLLADLSRSFLVRRDAGGEYKRLAVDFEALFLRGDLTQNIGLAPEDYLYFPPQDVDEVYVLGAVGRPGVSVYNKGMTAMRIVAAHGGFLPKAFRQRVLVVRGSLTRPQTFVVDAAGILDAQALDFPLQSRDIVYVSMRPWSRAEELLEAAISGFLRGAIVAAAGEMPALIQRPVVDAFK